MSKEFLAKKKCLKMKTYQIVLFTLTTGFPNKIFSIRCPRGFGMTSSKKLSACERIFLRQVFFRVYRLEIQSVSHLGIFELLPL